MKALEKTKSSCGGKLLVCYRVTLLGAVVLAGNGTMVDINLIRIAGKICEA
ncbi:hypothetical protein EJ03DRAFT_330532, partial [Teratosphaeria nubilosa]